MIRVRKIVKKHQLSKGNAIMVEMGGKERRFVRMQACILARKSLGDSCRARELDDRRSENALLKNKKSKLRRERKKKKKTSVSRKTFYGRKKKKKDAGDICFGDEVRRGHFDCFFFWRPAMRVKREKSEY